MKTFYGGAHSFSFMNATQNHYITHMTTTPSSLDQQALRIQKNMMRNALAKALRSGKHPEAKRCFKAGIVVDRAIMQNVMSSISLKTLRWAIKNQFISPAILLAEEKHQFDEGNLKYQISKRMDYLFLKEWIPAAIDMGESLTLWMIHTARNSGQDEKMDRCIELFLNHGAKLRGSEEDQKIDPDFFDFSPLEMVASRQQPKTLKRLLAQDSAQTIIKLCDLKGPQSTYYHRNLLTKACYEKDLQSMKLLWEHCDPAWVNHHGESICHIAARMANFAIFKWLKPKSLDWNQPNFMGHTPLHLFGKGLWSDENLDFLKWLLNHQTPSITLRGLDPLMCFLEKRDWQERAFNTHQQEIVKALISSVDLTHRDLLGCSVLVRLMDAQDEELIEVVTLKLKQRGLSDSEIENLKKTTPPMIDWASLRQDTEGPGLLVFQEGLERMAKTMKRNLPRERDAFIQSGLNPIDDLNPDMASSVSSIISSRHEALFSHFLTTPVDLSEVPTYWFSVTQTYSKALKAQFGKEILTVLWGNEAQIKQLSLETKDLPDYLKLKLWVELFYKHKPVHLLAKMTGYQQSFDHGPWNLLEVEPDELSQTLKAVRRLLLESSPVDFGADYHAIGNLYLQVLMEKAPDIFLDAPLLMFAVKHQWPVIQQIEWTEKLCSQVFQEETLNTLDFENTHVMDKLIELKSRYDGSLAIPKPLLHYLSQRAGNTSELTLIQMYHQATFEEIVALDERHENLLMCTVDSAESETSLFWLKKIIPQMNLHHQNLIGQTALQKATEQGKLQMAAVIRECQHAQKEATELTKVIQNIHSDLTHIIPPKTTSQRL